jgi:hypothetical protein
MAAYLAISRYYVVTAQFLETTPERFAYFLGLVTCKKIGPHSLDGARPRHLV